MFLPSFLVHCISSIEEQVPHRYRRIPLGLAFVGSAILALVSISLSSVRHHIIHIGAFAYRQVGTHDGMRSYGGYFWQIAALDRFAEAYRTSAYRAPNGQEFLQKDGPDIVVVGGENFFDLGGAGWRDLQLYLERSDIRGAVVAPHEIQFSYKERRLTLVRDLPPEFVSRFDRGFGNRVVRLEGQVRFRLFKAVHCDCEWSSELLPV